MIHGMNVQANMMRPPTGKEKKRAMRIIGDMAEALLMRDESDQEERKEVRIFIMYGMIT